MTVLRNWAQNENYLGINPTNSQTLCDFGEMMLTDA